MAWGDPSDYWWLRPTEPDNPLPAMQLGAQLRQQAIANALKQKDQQLETQRTGIQIQEYFSKKELQNKILAGNMKLAKTLSGTTDPASDDFARNLWGLLEEQPELGDTPQFREAMKFHETAKKGRIQRELIDASGYVSPDEATGAPGYFLDAKGGVRFAPQPRVSQGAPKWIPADEATGMPAHFETSGGRVQFAPRAMPDGTTFQPEEVTTSGGTRMVRVSPNRFTVLDKPVMTGKMTDVERQQAMDNRSQIRALASDLGDKPVITSTDSKRQKAALDSYNEKVSKIDALNKATQAIYTKSSAREGVKTSAAAPALPDVPPKPSGFSDSEILRQAAATVEKRPDLSEEIGRRLKAWGISPR